MTLAESDAGRAIVRYVINIAALRGRAKSSATRGAVRKIDPDMAPLSIPKVRWNSRVRSFRPSVHQQRCVRGNLAPPKLALQLCSGHVGCQLNRHYMRQRGV